MSSMTQRYQVIAESTFVRTNLDSHTTRGASAPEFEKNRNILRCSYRLWFSLLADFCLQANLSVEQTSAQLLRLSNIVESSTYIELSEICSDIYDQVRRLRLHTDFKYSVFKAQSTGNARKFWRILEPFMELVYYTGDPGWISCIMTICVYPFRTRVVDSKLNDEMLDAYLSIESDIKENDAKGYPDLLISGINNILKSWLRDWTEPIVPCLTSGAVSDPKLHSHADKYRSLAFCNLIDYMLRKEQGNSVQYYAPLPLSRIEDRTERITFVPKNATKLRTVCCQPVTLQYFQAGVQQSIYAYINTHKYLAKHIPLRDQEIPRRIAAQGSKYSTLATLDLSAASDRISWSLVKQLFAGTRYLRWMYATRAPYSYLPNGQTVISQKAFAMGACLCFPTMSLILAAVVRYVELRAPRYTRGVRPWTVYGDDIICPCDWSKAVMLCLSQLGLVVNESKSFFGYDDSYRESCGIECWNGYNVTPLRFPRTFSPTKEEGDLVSCFIQLANDFYLSSLYVARLTTFKMMKKYANCGPYGPENRQICFSDQEVAYKQTYSADILYELESVRAIVDPRGFLLSSSPTNYKTRHRWRSYNGERNSQTYLQRDEYLCLHTGLARKGLIWSEEDEDLRLFHRLLEMHRRSMCVQFSKRNWNTIAEDEYSFSAKLVPLLRRGWLCP